jgi:GDP/UDP-N,N'-diacetylbacillosamine 2-epimerase (hydrolysing)
MKKIVVATATRAEYGLLAPIIKKFQNDPDIDVRVVATGAHLSPEFGMTVKEIEYDGVIIDKKIEMLMSSDTSVGISKSMGLALISFAEYFDESKPDALMVLGDRYEMLAIACAAMNARIPIIHLSGGEATEGAIDEYIRNAITKMSFLHFTSTETYRNRVIQMGEAPDRVFCVGSMGVENAKNIQFLNKEELERAIGFLLGSQYAVLTFHPVTLENNTAKYEVEELMQAISKYPEITFLCTKANADTDGRIINACIEEYSQKNSNIILIASLGVQKYLSALKYAQFVIGNSSSGIVEAPSFKIPTINIGDRQLGRIQADSVINCNAIEKEIISAIEYSLSREFKIKLKDVKNPYGDGDTSSKIVSITKDFLMNSRINMKKKFYDIFNR